jgi:predicted amidohydrolase
MSQWSETRSFENPARTIQLTVCAHVESLPFADTNISASRITDLVLVDRIGDRSEAPQLLQTLKSRFVGTAIQDFLALPKFSTQADE